MGSFCYGYSSACTENIFRRGESILPLMPLGELEGSYMVYSMGQITMAKARAVAIASTCLDTKHTTVLIDNEEISAGGYFGAAVTELRNGWVHAPILNSTDSDCSLPR